MAPAVLNVLYPAAAADDFNMDYYLATHMPLVQKNWGPHGLQSWTVGVLDKEATGRHVQCVLVFADLDKFKAVSTDAAIMGDIPNFTKSQPEIWVGGVTGQWSA